MEPKAAKRFYRIVIDGTPGIDGTYKTRAVSQEYTDKRLARVAFKRLKRMRSYKGNNLRVQRRWATDWEDTNGRD